MTLVVTHAKVNTVADNAADVDPGGVLASDWNTAHTLTGTISVPQGGSGLSSATLGDIWYASAADTLSALAGNTTATRKFLRQTGNGAVSAAPAWDTILAADVPGSALTKVDDTNVTLTLGGSPTTALLNSASITAGWTGTLSLARGGTAANLSATGGTSQVLKQTTLGGAVTVGQLAASDLSNGTTGSGSVVLATSPTLVTQITAPLVIGGTTASSTLILESTSGTGTSDAILFKTGSQVERLRLDTSGQIISSLNGAFTSTPQTNTCFTGTSNGTGLSFVDATYGTGGCAGFATFYSNNATPGSQGLVTNNQQLSMFDSYGSTGAAFAHLGFMRHIVNGVTTATNIPTRWEWAVSMAGTAAYNICLRLDGNPTGGATPELGLYNNGAMFYNDSASNGNVFQWNGAGNWGCIINVSSNNWALGYSSTHSQSSNNQVLNWTNGGTGVTGLVGINNTAPKTVLDVGGPIATKVPATKTAAYTVVDSDSSLIFNGGAQITLTLPTASSFPGRWLYLKTIAAFAVVSASSNVAPIGSATAGTAILAATAGKFVALQSDGTNWIVMMAN